MRNVMAPKAKLILEIREGETGLWFVTSPDPRGLLVVGETRQEALEKTNGALNELAEAEAQARTA